MKRAVKKGKSNLRYFARVIYSLFYAFMHIEWLKVTNWSFLKKKYCEKDVLCRLNLSF